MKIAHEKLTGLDRECVVNALAPVLGAHHVDCVELVWRSDRGERVLEVTVEQPGTTEPGAGVTLELCTDISRDLSIASLSTSYISPFSRPSETFASL